MDDDIKFDMNARLLFELGVVNLNYQTICEYFGIPMKQRYNPNCGDWIVKWIKAGEQVRQNKRPDEMFNTGATPAKVLAEDSDQ